MQRADLNPNGTISALDFDPGEFNGLLSRERAGTNYYHYLTNTISRLLTSCLLKHKLVLKIPLAVAHLPLISDVS